MYTNTHSRPRGRDAFEVAIICALSIEADAMITLFDDNWEREELYEKADGDTNSYTIGRVEQHYVVLVHMPHMGKVSAASVAANLRSSFPRIRLGLLVGICGGVPFIDGGKREIILEDIIISTQIVQTDFGRQYPDSFVRMDTLQDSLGRPNPEIQGFLSRLQGKTAQIELEKQIQTNLVTILEAEGFEHSKSPGVHDDKLLEENYRHKHQDANACTICARCLNPGDSVCVKALDLPCTELGCDASKLVSRVRIQKTIDQGSSASPCHPVVHFDGVASGDQVIKSAQHRDCIAKQENIVAFEMEGAGLWETIPTIVIKGVCDYADSHKNKEWQLYAAATAAACAKSMLKIWRPTIRPVQNGRHGEVPVPSPIHQVFSGNFTAGKGIHQGGTYEAGSMNF
ncbi:hypothetical protein B7463_g8021, partial [Scytalidium lignicola]